MTVLLRLERPMVPAPERRRSRWRRRLGPAALVSLGLHVALIGGVLLWMRHGAPVVLVPEDNPATVQLVMSPPGGETPTAAAPQPEKPPAPETPQLAAATPQAPPAAQPTTEDAPPPAAAPPPPAPPAPRASDDKLTFDFADAESDTNALVTGDLMVPPSPDVKFHNRKPSYPTEAAFRGEQGAVVLLIHVSPVRPGQRCRCGAELGLRRIGPRRTRRGADLALPAVDQGWPAGAGRHSNALRLCLGLRACRLSGGVRGDVSNQPLAQASGVNVSNPPFPRACRGQRAQSASNSAGVRRATRAIRLPPRACSGRWRAAPSVTLVEPHASSLDYCVPPDHPHPRR